MGFVDSSLLPLKLLLFTFYGGLGCVLPFLTAHLRWLGFSSQEATFVQSVTPFVLVLGPPIAGIIADKLGRLKTLLILCLLLSGLSLTALLFVPALPRTRSSWTPNITFTCSPEASAVVVNKCGDTCPIPARRHLLSFSVSACRIRCNHTVFPDRLRRTMGGYPNLCVSKFGEPDPERSQCREMGATFEEDPFLFSSPLPRYVKKPFTCYYPLILFQYQGEEYTRLSCPNVEPGCAVWCDAKETVAPYPSHARPAPAEGVPEQINKLRRSPRPGFNDSSVCRVAQEGTAGAPGELRLPRSSPHGALWNSPLWSFFLYLSLRSLAELLPATAVALLNTLTLTVLSAHPLASFGQQHLWAVMGFGFFAPLCGYLMDYHRGLFGVADFAPCFYALDALLLLSALLVAVLPVPFPRPRENKWWRNLSVHILASGQVWALFGLALVCGVFWGALEIFLPPYLLELGSSRLTLGLGVTAGVLPAIPLLFFSRPILRLAGCFNLGAIALIVYALRQAVYSYVRSPWLFLPADALSSVTLHVLWASLVSHLSDLNPQTMNATVQGFLVFMHFGIGRGVAALVGSEAIGVWGLRDTLRLLAIAALALALGLLAIHSACLKGRSLRLARDFRRRKKRAAEPLVRGTPLVTLSLKHQPVSVTEASAVTSSPVLGSTYRRNRALGEDMDHELLLCSEAEMPASSKLDPKRRKKKRKKATLVPATVNGNYPPMVHSQSHPITAYAVNGGRPEDEDDSGGFLPFNGSTDLDGDLGYASLPASTAALATRPAPLDDSSGENGVILNPSLASTPRTHLPPTRIFHPSHVDNHYPFMMAR